MQEFLQAVATGRVIAILRARDGLSVEGAVASAAALGRGGIQVLEITLNTPGALDGISALTEAQRDGSKRQWVGAGTVLSAADAIAAMAAGAEFLVTPTLEPDVLSAAGERGVPVVCGAYTPTEILQAHRLGAALVKIFPATSLGPGFVRDLLGPLPFLQLAAVGGVTAANVGDFLSAGCVGVGAGSALFDGQLAAEARFDELETRARQWSEAVNAWQTTRKS